MTEAEWTEPYFRSFNWPQAGQLHGRALAPDPYHTGDHADALRQWLVDTARYLRSVDSHPHVVACHVSLPPHLREIWGPQYGEATEFVHNNAYTSFSQHWEQGRFRLHKGVADVLHVFDEFFRPLRRRRPLLVGEWGGKPEENRESHLVAELHTGLWASHMTSVSGLTGYWWWNLIDAYDLYGSFRAVAAFAEGEDRRAKGYRSSYVTVYFAEAGTRDSRWERRALALSNADTLFAYVFTGAINTANDSMVPESWLDPAFPASGPGKLYVPPGLSDGSYQLEYWDTFEGRVVDTLDVTVSADQRHIPLINHRVDLALKLKPRR